MSATKRPIGSWLSSIVLAFVTAGVPVTALAGPNRQGGNTPPAEQRVARIASDVLGAARQIVRDRAHFVGNPRRWSTMSGDERGAVLWARSTVAENGDLRLTDEPLCQRELRVLEGLRAARDVDIARRRDTGERDVLLARAEELLSSYATTNLGGDEARRRFGVFHRQPWQEPQLRRGDDHLRFVLEGMTARHELRRLLEKGGLRRVAHPDLLFLDRDEIDRALSLSDPLDGAQFAYQLSNAIADAARSWEEFFDPFAEWAQQHLELSDEETTEHMQSLAAAYRPELLDAGLVGDARPAIRAAVSTVAHQFRADSRWIAESGLDERGEERERYDRRVRRLEAILSAR